MANSYPAGARLTRRAHGPAGRRPPAAPPPCAPAGPGVPAWLPVPRRPALSRRITTAVMWPLGVGLTSWHYMWRTTPLHRRELPGSRAHDAPPPIPTGTAGEDLQLVEDGVGPLFHRRYQARIADAGI